MELTCWLFGIGKHGIRALQKQILVNQNPSFVLRWNVFPTILSGGILSSLMPSIEDVLMQKEADISTTSWARPGALSNKKLKKKMEQYMLTPLIRLI